jgi:hypothetical protein
MRLLLLVLELVSTVTVHFCLERMNARSKVYTTVYSVVVDGDTVMKQLLLGVL